MFSKTAHIDIIEEIAKGLKAVGMNKRYLELGIAKAKCFNRVAPYFDYNIAVDISDAAYDYINIKREKRLFCNMDTDEFFKLNQRADKFNLIFIDANHDFKNVQRDLINSWNVLKDNGIIILHDTYPPDESYLEHCKDAYKIRKYLDVQKYDELCPIGFKESEQVEYITLPFYYGLTIIRKYKNHLAWQK